MSHGNPKVKGDDVRRLLRFLTERNLNLGDKDIERIIQQENVKFFAVNKAGSLIGFAILVMHEDNFLSMSARMGKIGDVVVDGKYQGKGFGKILMKEVIKFAKDAGLKYLELNSNPKRIAANKLYVKLGFKLVGQLPGGSNYYRLYLN